MFLPVVVVVVVVVLAVQAKVVLWQSNRVDLIKYMTFYATWRKRWCPASAPCRHPVRGAFDMSCEPGNRNFSVSCMDAAATHSVALRHSVRRRHGDGRYYRCPLMGVKTTKTMNKVFSQVFFMRYQRVYYDVE